MRTYELHASFKQVKRADGRSSVAAAAYRSGTRLVDERTGEVNDYTRKGGVEHSAIFAPAGSPSWATDRSQLWNAAEQKENRSNSMTARELEVGFPSEFNAAQRREAGSLIAQRLVEKFGVAVDIAYHEPGKVEGDHPNYHAHILFTGRGINKDGWEKNKYRDFNSDRIEIDGEKTTIGKVTVKEWRSWVADCFNQIAERERLEVKTEHLSFEERGLDKLPTVKMGVAATQMEGKGIKTDRGNLNRRIQGNNTAQAEMLAVRRELNQMVAKMHKALRDQNEKANARLTPEKIKRIREAHHNRMVKEYEDYVDNWHSAKTEISMRDVDLQQQQRRYPREPDPDKYRNWLGWITDKKLEEYNSDWRAWNKGKKEIEEGLKQVAIDRETNYREQGHGIQKFEYFSKSRFEKDHPEVVKEEARIFRQQQEEAAKQTKKPVIDMKALMEERQRRQQPNKKKDRDLER